MMFGNKAHVRDSHTPNGRDVLFRLRNGELKDVPTREWQRDILASLP